MGLRGYPQYGPAVSEIGANIDSATPQITSPLHHVVSTVELTTLTPPFAMLGFIGPTYLVADSVFAWTTSGNIESPQGTTLTADKAYGFVYSKTDAKWHPIVA